MEVEMPTLFKTVVWECLVISIVIPISLPVAFRVSFTFVMTLCLLFFCCWVVLWKDEKIGNKY